MSRHEKTYCLVAASCEQSCLVEQSCLGFGVALAFLHSKRVLSLLIIFLRIPSTAHAHDRRTCSSNTQSDTDFLKMWWSLQWK